MLTPKQKAFADYYIECGNATEAAKKAGYKQPHVQGSQNLEKLSVSAYIAERMKKIESNRIAEASEVLEFYTAVMRGEQKDQFGLDASLSDRLKAADALIKRYDAGKSVPGGTKREDDPLSKAMKEEALRMNDGHFA